MQRPATGTRWHSWWRRSPRSARGVEVGETVRRKNNVELNVTVNIVTTVDARTADENCSEWRERILNIRWSTGREILTSRSLPDIQARTVARSIVSRLDYCNSLLVGTAQTNVIKLQRAQNSVARIVTGTSRFDHIQPVIKELHWLPIDYRIKFKVAMLVYKIRQTGRPAYLSDFIYERAVERASRSSNMHHMEVPRRKLETGKRAFSYAAPTIWNNLPQTIRQMDLASVSLSSFKKTIKDTFFSVLPTVNWLVFFPRTRIACDIWRVINAIYIHTYIHTYIEV